MSAPEKCEHGNPIGYYCHGSEGYCRSQQTLEIDGVEYSAEQVRERIAELKPMSDK